MGEARGPDRARPAVPAASVAASSRLRLTTNRQWRSRGRGIDEVVEVPLEGPGGDQPETASDDIPDARRGRSSSSSTGVPAGHHRGRPALGPEGKALSSVMTRSPTCGCWNAFLRRGGRRRAEKTVEFLDGTKAQGFRHPGRDRPQLGDHQRLTDSLVRRSITSKAVRN